MKRRTYIIAAALAFALSGPAQSQTLPILGDGLPGLDALPLLGGGNVPGLDAIPVLGGGASPLDSLLITNIGPDQAQALSTLGSQFIANTANGLLNGGLQGILLQGQSPLMVAGLPTIVDPFDSENIASFFDSIAPLAPLRAVIPTSAVAEFTQIAFGGDGPFLITGLQEALDSGEIPLFGSFLGDGGIPVIGSFLGSDDSGIPVIGGFLGGDGGSLPFVGAFGNGGIPVIGGLLGGGMVLGGGQGLPMDEIPLPLEQLDGTTLTGLLGGGTLTGL